MRLIRIELRNFKSFGDDPPTSIDLEPGMNVLSGPNGAGKSSVLEAVGLVLFQRKPPNVSQKAFARLGGGSWEVTVVFEGVDKLAYRVVRSERKCVLFQEGKDEELASGVKLVDERLRDLTGVDPDMPPAEFFKRVLCSPQGEYTRDLEQSPNDRKKLFDPLFKVDRFKALDSNLATISGKNKGVLDKTMGLVEEAGILRERAAALGETRKRKDTVEREMRQRTKEREEVAEQLTTVRAQLDALGAKRKRLDDLRHALEMSQQRLEGQAEKVKGARQRVDEAEKAAARREEHRAGKEEHDRARRLLEELAPRQKKAKETVDSHKEATARRRNTTQNLEKARGNHERWRKVVDAEGPRVERLDRDLRKAREDLDAAEARASGRKGDLENMRAAREEARVGLERATHVLKDLLAEEVEIRDEEKRLGELRAAAARAEERREEQGRLPQLQDGLKKLRARHSATCAQIEYIERDRKILELGQCPFVGVDCPGIEGRSISDEVTRKLGDLNSTRVDLDKEIDEYEHWILKAQGAEKELEEAERAGEKARELEGALENRRRKLRTRLDEVTPSKVAEDLLRLAMALDDLRGSPDLDVRKELEELQGKAVASPQRAEAPLESLERHFARLDERARAIIEDQEAEGQKVRELDTRREGLARELKGAREKLAAAEEEVKRLDHELEDLADRQAKIERELSSLDSEMATVKRVEEEERELLELRARTEEDHVEYLRLETLAEDLKKRRETLIDREREESAMTEALEAETRKVREAEAELGEGRELEDLEARRDALTKRESELGTQIKRDVTDLEDLEKKIAEMQRAKDEARKLQRTIDAYYQAGKLLHGVRRVFQNAAPKLARRYLETVGREATRGYRSLAPGDPAEIVWKEDYQVLLRGRFGEDDAVTEKDFSMLSGGEQMAVAIALKLALARVFSTSKVLFLDEPTIHLDESRRENLAEHLTRTSADLGFEQLVVISHDATFDSTHQHAVRLSKIDGTSRVTT